MQDQATAVATDDAAPATPEPNRPDWYLTHAQMRALAESKAVGKAVEDLRRTIKCVICDKPSLAPLVRVDRVLSRHALASRGEKGREYVHGPCIKTLQDKYHRTNDAKPHHKKKEAAA